MYHTFHPHISPKKPFREKSSTSASNPIYLGVDVIHHLLQLLLEGVHLSHEVHFVVCLLQCDLDLVEGEVRV